MKCSSIGKRVEKKSELYEMQDATSRLRPLTTENVNIFRVKKKLRKPTGNLTLCTVLSMFMDTACGLCVCDI